MLNAKILEDKYNGVDSDYIVRKTVIGSPAHGHALILTCKKSVLVLDEAKRTMSTHDIYIFKCDKDGRVTSTKELYFKSYTRVGRALKRHEILVKRYRHKKIY